MQDPSIRSAICLDLEGAVVIIDEAHNVEGVCRDAGSIELSMLNMAKIALDLCFFNRMTKYRWVGGRRCRGGGARGGWNLWLAFWFYKKKKKLIGLYGFFGFCLIRVIDGLVWQVYHYAGLFRRFIRFVDVMGSVIDWLGCSFIWLTWLWCDWLYWFDRLIEQVQSQWTRVTQDWNRKIRVLRYITVTRI